MLKILASSIALFAATPVFAVGTMDCWLGKSDCQDLVGKRFWVRPMGAETKIEVTFVQGDWDKTAKLGSGSLVITGVVDNRTYGHDLAVRLPDGRSGWMSHMSSHLLSPTDPAEDARKDAARAEANRQDCERRGQPRIGMTPAELVETCWRRPARIIKKTTASGVEESFIYGLGHIVKVTDGKVSEIIEAR